jgi:branched-subunit amino acid ABC-type transport system permease component
VLYRTRIGMVVRAGIEDSAMVDALGIDVYKIFMLVFGIGAMAAGFAGIVNAPVVSIAPDVGESILVQTFVVVVIGGVGSFPGAALGGLIAGDHQHHLDVQPGLLLRHVVRGHDVGVGAAAVWPAWHGGPRMSAST